MFGYGSLVSRTSIALTIGREVTSSDGFTAARLNGYGRRWNYGSRRQRGAWSGPNGAVESGVVVCLGIVASSHEGCNGVVVRVSDDELARLDVRESDYDRVDVTDQVSLRSAGVSGRIVTYVPRRSAIDRYVTASAAGRAAVELRYHSLVEDAFLALGHPELDEYRSTTPAPDVPVLEFRPHRLPV